MTDFEAMRRATSDLRDLARTTRLACEKLVKMRKDAVKLEIVSDATAKLTQHIQLLNARSRGFMPVMYADFAVAAKGKRNIDSLRDAVETELARVKIEANEVADRIQLNLETKGLHGYEFLFADLRQICTKANEDFVNTVNARISARITEQERIKAEAKLEAQRESIRREAVAEVPAEGFAEVETWTKPDTDGVITNIAPPRKSVRAMVDNMLDGMSESALREVLDYLQINFTRLAA